jgi:hypothetical protein
MYVKYSLPLTNTLKLECVTTPPLSLRSCLYLYTSLYSYSYRLQQSDIHHDPARGKLLAALYWLKLTFSHTTQSSRMSSRTGSRSKSLSGHSSASDGWILRHVNLIDPRPSRMDIQFVDYDNVRFHLSTQEAKTVITLSMAIQCWPDLVKYGARDHLASTYGEYLLGDAETEPEYNVSLRIDLEKIPSTPGTPILSYQEMS